MNIVVLSDEHFPHTGADTEVIIHTAAARGAAGADVQLIVPRLWWRHRSDDEVLAYYGVRRSFRLVRVPAWPPPGRKLRLEKLLHGVLGPILGRLRGADFVHSRDGLPLFAAQLCGIPWSFETYRRHAEEKPWLPSLLRGAGLGHSLGAVAHSQACGEDLLRLGFPAEAVLVAPCGCAPELYDLDKSEARRQLGLPESATLVGYAGNVGAAKGSDEVLDLAAALPEVALLLVGGTAAQVEAVRRRLAGRGLGNVILAGHQPPARVPAYLLAADLLFVPTLHRNAFAGSIAEHLPLRLLPGTPLKIFGYLAAGRPIVAADQAINREILRHEHTALLFPPDDVSAAAEAVRRLQRQPALAQALAEAARAEAQRYTWARRGQDMVAFFERRLRARG